MDDYFLAAGGNGGVGILGENDVIDDLIMTNAPMSHVEMTQLYQAFDDVSLELLGGLLDNYEMRLQQTNIVQETVLFDKISLQDDSLMWEVSADGGHSWWRVFDIVNMVEGLISFPLEGQGDALKIRVRAMSSGDWIAGFVLFPKYKGKM